MDVTSISKNCTRTEFVGTAVLDTIGLVISGADEQLLRQMGLGMKYRSLGVYSSRTGAAGQLTALDEAVKSTNTEILSVELPRDTKGWGGHGNYAVIGGDTPSDVRRAIEIALSLTDKYAGELYISEAGHLEFAYSSSAGKVLEKAFGAKLGQAFGFLAGSPASIGLVMADNAVKAAEVEIVNYMTPDQGNAALQRSDPRVFGQSGQCKRSRALRAAVGVGTFDRDGELSERSGNFLSWMTYNKERGNYEKNTGVFVGLRAGARFCRVRG